MEKVTRFAGDLRLLLWGVRGRSQDYDGTNRGEQIDCWQQSSSLLSLVGMFRTLHIRGVSSGRQVPQNTLPAAPNCYTANPIPSQGGSILGCGVLGGIYPDLLTHSTDAEKVPFAGMGRPPNAVSWRSGGRW